MVLTNVILLSQAAGYAVALILSLCMSVPLLIHEKDFNGHCLLFSRGTWREQDGQFVVDWASTAYCNYVAVIGIIIGIASLVQLYRMALHLWRGTDSSFLSAFIDAVSSLFLCVSTAIAALFVTLGFDLWCRDITQRFESCLDATDNPIDKQDGIDTSNFYMQMGAAQFGTWSSWVCWVALSMCAVIKLCKYHQQENVRISMAKERQRHARLQEELQD